jgi:hypothetical protein
MPQTVILCPLYNDEASFNIFAANIEKSIAPKSETEFSFLIVNDGTSELKLKTNLSLTIIHLHRNIGHQKAIAIGLAYAHHHLTFDQIVIMDCDGEDKPEDIVLLLEAGIKTSTIIVAQRTSRQEGNVFQFFYGVYKMIFFILTGKRISFGNFMLLPKNEVDKIAYYSEIWNHLAGSIIKSKISYTAILSHRGKRYEGKSKMNFGALLLHGLGAIGVFIEIIAIRLLVFSLFMVFVSILIILIGIFVKLFTANAIPGWATTVVSSMLIIILQSFLLSLFTIFLYLSFQSQRKFIPAYHYKDYVRAVEN